MPGERIADNLNRLVHVNPVVTATAELIHFSHAGPGEPGAGRAQQGSVGLPVVDGSFFEAGWAADPFAAEPWQTPALAHQAVDMVFRDNSPLDSAVEIGSATLYGADDGLFAKLALVLAGCAGVTLRREESGFDQLPQRRRGGC